jgi:hypothetical protein
MNFFLTRKDRHFLGQFLWDRSIPQEEYLEVYYLITVKKIVHYGTSKTV